MTKLFLLGMHVNLHLSIHQMNTRKYDMVKNKKLLVTGIALAVVIIFAIVAVVMVLNHDKSNQETALKLNTSNLDNLALPHAKEVWRKSDISCDGPNLSDRPSCTTAETRVYTVQGSVDQLKSALIDKFKDQGWLYYTNGDFGYFTRGSRSPVIAEANTTRGATDKDIAIGGDMEDLSVSITDKVPNINQDFANTYFRYSDPALEQKFKSAVNAEGKVYVVTSWVKYHKWF